MPQTATRMTAMITFSAANFVETAAATSATTTSTILLLLLLIPGYFERSLSCSCSWIKSATTTGTSVARTLSPWFQGFGV